MNFHLAQVNIAIARYTREDPLSANDDAEATFGEPDPIFNMSLWETKEALSDFAYKSDHVDVLRKARRRVRSAEQADTGTVVAECRHDSDKIGSPASPRSFGAVRTNAGRFHVRQFLRSACTKRGRTWLTG